MEFAALLLQAVLWCQLLVVGLSVCQWLVSGSCCFFFHLQSYSLPYEAKGVCRDSSTEYLVGNRCCSKCHPGKMTCWSMMWWCVFKCLNVLVLTMWHVLISIQGPERRVIAPAWKIRCAYRVLRECTPKTWIISQTASHAANVKKVGVLL